MRIAVTTPTGHIGGHLADLLLEDGEHEVVLLARYPEKLEAKRKRGAVLVQADLSDAASLVRATAGVDALFFLCPPNYTSADYLAYYRAIARNGAQAIATNQIPHTVALSAIGAHLPSGTGPVLGLRDSEALLREAVARPDGSDLGLTFLRAALFMDTYMDQVQQVKLMKSVYLPMSGDCTVPMISTVDIAARAAREIVRPPPARPATHDLLGPKDYSLDECAAIISEGVGKTVRHVQISGDQFRALTVGMGWGGSASRLMLQMYEWIQSDTGRDYVRSAENTTPTTFDAFVQDELAPAVRA